MAQQVFVWTVLAVLLLGFGHANAHHGTLKPPKPRGAGPEDVTPAERVPAPPGVAVPGAALAPAALAAIEPGARSHAIAPLAQQTSDEIIARDHATMDALEAKLASLPDTAADAWRTSAARAWIAAARHEYDDHDPTGFPQAAFDRAVVLAREIEAGMPRHTSETVPTAVPPTGSARIADSLHVQLESLKRGPGFTCAAPWLAELEVVLAWAGNEHVGPGDCSATPLIVRARELAAEAARRAEGCSAPSP